ncbi:MAG: hypothetical protein ACRBFS_21885 [Aureispira sp.]
MQLDPKKIKGETFSLTTLSKKFRIASSKKYVKGALEELGGIVNTKGGKQLIGRETTNFGTSNKNGTFIFEGELEDRSYQQDFKHFKDIDLKLYDMLRELLATTNIKFTFIRIGVPVKEAEFEKLEKKLKRKIPAAVKEFYSIFGELRILWDYRTPYKDTGRSANLKSWNIDYRDNHKGSFQILPLKMVLFEKWEDEAYCFDVGSELKLFDTSSEYHPVALDITDEGDPFVYRGEDHGIQFREASPFLFTDYIKLCIGLYGTRERLRYFQLMGLGSNYNKTDQEIAEAIAGKVVVDINNDAYIQPKLDAAKTSAENALADKDGERLLSSIQKHDLHTLNAPLFYAYLIDVDRLKQNAASFAQRVTHQVKDENFDWEAYEAKYANDPIFESKEYLKAKKKFSK